MNGSGSEEGSRAAGSLGGGGGFPRLRKWEKTGLDPSDPRRGGMKLLIFLLIQTHNQQWRNNIELRNRIVRTDNLHHCVGMRRDPMSPRGSARPVWTIRWQAAVSAIKGWVLGLLADGAPFFEGGETLGNSSPRRDVRDV